MPVIHHPPRRPLPPNHPFASPTIIIGMKQPTPGEQQGSMPAAAEPVQPPHDDQSASPTTAATPSRQK